MSSRRPARDWIYLSLAIVHMTAMIGVDFVEFYPPGLISKGGALHFLDRYRNWYINTMSDPYYELAVPGHFFRFSVYVELLVQFPLALYFIYTSLTASGGLTGPAELAGTMYATIVGLFTALVCYDTWYMSNDVLDEATRKTLFWQVYSPFGFLACFMAVDMYARLLNRLRRLDGKTKHH